jgi:hypothetical protein
MLTDSGLRSIVHGDDPDRFSDVPHALSRYDFHLTKQLEIKNA